MAAANKDQKIELAEQLVLDLSNSDVRENSLRELSKMSELFQDLGPLLWNSVGTIAALLQEIVSIYPVLSPPNLTLVQSNRVCDVLTLLQCVALNPDTKMSFVNARIPEYIYPLAKTNIESRPFENLRIYSLGVIATLVKVNDTEVISCLLSSEIIPICLRTMEIRSESSKSVNDTEVISCLLSSEIIPLCLRTMEMRSESSKSVATFIVHKILINDYGLDFICTTAERFFRVGQVLAKVVAACAEQPSSRLLKHVIGCYVRLTDDLRARNALRTLLPDVLRDITFSSSLREDPAMRRWLMQLLVKVQGPRVALEAGGRYKLPFCDCTQVDI